METRIEADAKESKNFLGDHCLNLREKSWHDGDRAVRMIGTYLPFGGVGTL